MTISPYNVAMRIYGRLIKVSDIRLRGFLGFTNLKYGNNRFYRNLKEWRDVLKFIKYCKGWYTIC